MAQLLQDFELARGKRLWDGVALWAARRDHGSVYLLGYHAEMTLKCAYFTVVGLRPSDTINKLKLSTAVARVKILGVTRDHKSYHSIRFWADALVAERTARLTPLPVATQTELLAHADAIEARWNVEMRYIGSAVRAMDVELVAASVDWLDRNYNVLVR